MSIRDRPAVIDHRGGALLTVHLKPSARRRALGEVTDEFVSLSVKAHPQGGKANSEACALLAELLGVSKGSMEVVRGRSSRRKAIFVDGLTASKARKMLGQAESGR